MTSRLAPDVDDPSRRFPRWDDRELATGLAILQLGVRDCLKPALSMSIRHGPSSVGNRSARRERLPNPTMKTVTSARV